MADLHCPPHSAFHLPLFNFFACFWGYLSRGDGGLLPVVLLDDSLAEDLVVLRRLVVVRAVSLGALDRFGVRVLGGGLRLAVGLVNGLELVVLLVSPAEAEALLDVRLLSGCSRRG